MAVNLADMQAVGVVLASPIMAGVVGASRHAGWYIPLYVVGGAALGIALAWTIRFVAYRAFPYREGDGILRQWLSVLAYLLGPPVISIGVWFFIMMRFFPNR
ncbi:MAG: hypothetical protein KKH95_13130 [Gammaproteobacteria bacterium]|nr:hypothetical protein [Gammaproteobacteria bacterium]